MQPHQFSLLVQAAGTVLLFVVFLLSIESFAGPPFLDWIASWAFFLLSLLLLWFMRSPIATPPRLLLLAQVAAMLAHVFFLLRGVWRFREEQPASRPIEMLWAIPILGAAWLLSSLPVTPAGGMGGASLFPARRRVRGHRRSRSRSRPGRPEAARSSRCRSWCGDRARRHGLRVSAVRRHGSPCPSLSSTRYFLEMFVEMTIGVGIIILLFEASQSQLQEEMQRLVESDSAAKEMGIRDRLTGLYNRHYFNDVIRRELAAISEARLGTLVLLIDVDRFKEINDVRGHQVGDEVSSSWPTI
jgi:hypothetical protein